MCRDAIHTLVCKVSLESPIVVSDLPHQLRAQIPTHGLTASPPRILEPLSMLVLLESGPTIKRIASITHRMKPFKALGTEYNRYAQGDTDPTTSYSNYAWTIDLIDREMAGSGRPRVGLPVSRLTFGTLRLSLSPGLMTQGESIFCMRYIRQRYFLTALRP